MNIGETGFANHYTLFSFMFNRMSRLGVAHVHGHMDKLVHDHKNKITGIFIMLEFMSQNLGN